MIIDCDNDICSENNPHNYYSWGLTSECYADLVM